MVRRMLNALAEKLFDIPYSIVFDNSEECRNFNVIFSYLAHYLRLFFILLTQNCSISVLQISLIVRIHTR